MITKLALLLLLHVRVVVLDPTLPRAWVESLVWEASALHGQTFLPTRYRRDPLEGKYMSWAWRSVRIMGLRNSRLHRRATRRNAKVLYLHGATTEGYIGGSAFVGNNIATGHVKLVLADGRDGSAHAVTVITHEVGHMRGAGHVLSETIMNTYGLGFPVQPRTWDPVSLEQMK